ncbi:hypothetical protein DsansV1_C19g0156661 [Dioscorea sansibarensis]
MEAIAACVGRAELGAQEIVIGEPRRKNARVSAQERAQVSRGVAAIQERGVQRNLRKALNGDEKVHMVE